MLGPDIFVAPILAAGGNVTVHFPAGDNWVYLFDTTLVKTGGASEALNFPLSEFPVYIRQSSAWIDSISDPGLTSIHSPEAPVEFSVYPNPANNFVTLSVVQGQSLVRIYNAMGQLVTSSVVEKQRSTIDISSLASGVYYLHLQSEDGVGVKRFEVVR